MKRLVTALLAAGITVSSMTAVFAEPAHKGTDTGTNDGGQLTADFRRSPGDAVKDLYRQAAPFLTKEITLRNHAVYTPFVMTPSAKKWREKRFRSVWKKEEYFLRDSFSSLLMREALTPLS